MGTRVGRTWAAIAVASALALVPGCGGEDEPDGTKIAIVTPGSRDDVDLTRQTVDAVKQVARTLGVGATVVDGSQGSAAGALERAAEDAKLLIAPYSGDRAAAVKAAKETEVPTLVWGDPDALTPDLVGDVEVDVANGAYAAGALAVTAALTRSVGIVICDDAPPAEMASRFRTAAAYVAGARYTNPKAKVGYEMAGSDVDSAHRASVKLTKRVQMILGLCGSATEGVVRGVDEEDYEDQYVGIVGDKATVNEGNIVITSIVWNPKRAFAQAMRDVEAGTFGKRVYTLDLANGGVTLLQTGRTPSDAYEAAMKAKRDVLNELVGLPDVDSEETLKAYIASGV